MDFFVLLRVYFDVFYQVYRVAHIILAKYHHLTVHENLVGMEMIIFSETFF